MYISVDINAINAINAICNILFAICYFAKMGCFLERNKKSIEEMLNLKLDDFYK